MRKEEAIKNIKLKSKKSNNHKRERRRKEKKKQGEEESKREKKFKGTKKDAVERLRRAPTKKKKKKEGRCRGGDRARTGSEASFLLFSFPPPTISRKAKAKAKVGQGPSATLLKQMLDGRKRGGASKPQNGCQWGNGSRQIRAHHSPGNLFDDGGTVASIYGGFSAFTRIRIEYGVCNFALIMMMHRINPVFACVNKSKNRANKRGAQPGNPQKGQAFYTNLCMNRVPICLNCQWSLR